MKPSNPKEMVSFWRKRLQRALVSFHLFSERRPREDSQKVTVPKLRKRPHQKLTLLASCFKTSSFQNGEKIKFLLVKPFNLQYFVMAALTG